MATSDKLKGLIQYPLPHHGISRLLHWATRREAPRGLVQMGIQRFIDAYGVAMSEAANPNPHAYTSFNRFFTRELAAGVRPLDTQPRSIVSPVDGAVSQAGRITEGRIFQAKGHDFTAAELLGGETERAAPFLNGQFTTLYLAPRDYHRIHMPVTGTLREMVHVPGRLFSVSPATVRSVPRLFARNERIACLFDTDHGPMAVVLVGALNVGSMETVWAGEVTPPTRRRVTDWQYSAGGVVLEKGAELGRFNMGSTVILLFPENTMDWDTTLTAESRVQMGTRIGAFKEAP
ncbi:MAG TPA: archaetidylserine decarboxylase [Gammaproteobacteria bacterium]|nr:archaetidylserine decarboxylase [Gammaproteobacteria bacterium]